MHLRSPYFPLVLLLLIGISIFQIGMNYPVYSNDKAVQELEELGEKKLITAEQYFQQRTQYETPHRLLTNIGGGISILSISCALAFWLLKIKSHSDFLRVQSPKSRWVFMGLLNVAWLALIPATWHALTLDDCPNFAEADGAPFMALLLIGSTLPIINLIGIFIIGAGELPVALTMRSTCKFFPTVIVNGLSVIACLLLCVLLIWVVWLGPFLMVPSIIIALYLLLSSRAVLLNRRTRGPFA